MPKVLLLILLCGPVLAAQADIYKYVDQNGHITYSNVPQKGARRLDLAPISTISPPKAKHSQGAQSGAADFPRVDGATQKKRDVMRQQLLREELATEEQKLADAKQALKDGEAVRLGNERNYQKYLDRIQGLKDEVTRHEQNVEALQKELSGTQ